MLETLKREWDAGALLATVRVLSNAIRLLFGYFLGTRIELYPFDFVLFHTNTRDISNICVVVRI